MKLTATEIDMKDMVSGVLYRVTGNNEWEGNIVVGNTHSMHVINLTDASYWCNGGVGIRLRVIPLAKGESVTLTQE